MDAWAWAQKIAELKITLKSFLDNPLWEDISQDNAKWALVTLHTERLQPLLQSSLLDKLRVFWNYGQTLGISFSLEEKSKLGRRRQSHGKRSLEAGCFHWMCSCNRWERVRNKISPQCSAIFLQIKLILQKKCHFNQTNFRDEISFQLQK